LEVCVVKAERFGAWVRNLEWLEQCPVVDVMAILRTVVDTV
jgi:hypothetical protein